MKYPIRPLPWSICLLLAILAYFLKFHARGYGFSALVCCFLIGILGFYEVTWMLRLQHPAAIGLIRRIFTGCLAAGLLVVGITEAVIIRASFGTPNDHAQYMVVLGAKVRPTGPSASLWDRLYAAADYMTANPDVIAVVSGGQGPDEPWPEAEVMKAELVALGISEDRIWREDHATSTWENLTFSLDLIEERTGTRPEKLAVLSSEYHLFRASLFARACHVDFVGVPARTSRASQAVNHFMREVAGVWHYLILGGQYD